MKLNKKTVLFTSVIPLFIAAFLIGCGQTAGLTSSSGSAETTEALHLEVNTEPSSQSQIDTQQPEQAFSFADAYQMADCVLTIHYDDAMIFKWYPYETKDLIADDTDWTHHVTICGDVLLRNDRFMALLEKLRIDELPLVRASLEDYPQMQPTIYYVLETNNGEKIFDVSVGWKNGTRINGSAQLDSVFFNGEKIPYDEEFYYAVAPYLTEPHYIPYTDIDTRLNPTTTENTDRVENTAPQP